MKRVLVTRPEPGATRTAERLKQLGYEPVKLPLTRTVGLSPRLSSSKFEMVIATSAQAFLHLPKQLAEALADLATFVVGAATAAAARQAGFRNVQVGGSDVDALLSNFKGSLKAPAKILYLCGRVRRPDLEQTLALNGVDVEVVEVYDTILVSYSTDKLKHLNHAPIDAVLVTSVTSAEALNTLSALSNVGQPFDNSLFICLSKRIADALKKGANARIAVCSTPDEEGMMAQLDLQVPL